MLAVDIFGTVVDWRGGIVTQLTDIARDRELMVDGHELTFDTGAFADSWRRRISFLLDRVSRRVTRYRVIDEIHRKALDDVIKKFSLKALTDADRERLIWAWHHLPAWPDVLGLNRLRAVYVLTTLSNGGMAQQVDVVRAAGLPFDCILSTELAATYKPDPKAYQLVPYLLRVRPDQVLMVASHPYDLAAAAKQGFQTAFVSRPQEWGTGNCEFPDFPVDIEAEDFIDLAAKLGA